MVKKQFKELKPQEQGLVIGFILPILTSFIGFKFLGLNLGQQSMFITPLVVGVCIAWYTIQILKLYRTTETKTTFFNFIVYFFMYFGIVTLMTSGLYIIEDFTKYAETIAFFIGGILSVALSFIIVYINDKLKIVK